MTSRLKTIATVAALLVLGAAAAACGGSDNKSSTSPTTAAPTGAPAASSSATRPAGGGANNVTVADFSFTPARFNAVAGQQVSITVTNSGNQPHTFTITGVVDSGRIDPGQTKTVTFTPAQAGNLIYFCTIHGQARMSGQVMVSGTSGSLPPADDAGPSASMPVSPPADAAY